jgi:hypothetical protein
LAARTVKLATPAPLVDLVCPSLNLTWTFGNTPDVLPSKTTTFNVTFDAAIVPVGYIGSFMIYDGYGKTVQFFVVLPYPVAMASI